MTLPQPQTQHLPMSLHDKRRAAARRRAQQWRRPRVSRLLAWLLSTLLGTAGWAQAQAQAQGQAQVQAPKIGSQTLPVGGHVVVGNAQLQQQGSLLVIQQNTGKLGLDWLSFNIGSGATVEFRQPDASAVALNRVIGNSGSEIYGQLKANGQVFLSNPNGVLFAPGAKVDVGGLVASTLDLSQQDFADGRYSFVAREGSTGSVVNQGHLQASAGGYLALFGHQVSNGGSLSVQAGSVLLASGRAATVSISGSGLLSAVVAPGALPGSVHNSGSISADGGTVTLSAKSAQDIAASLVNNSGIIRANTLVERSGEIWITGDNVATSGHITAAAPEGGDAGRIMVIGDLQRGSVQVAGTLDASAAAGGRGGFIETSAARVKVNDSARLSTAAAQGRTGTWLIDPVDFTIAASGGDITGSALAGRLASNNVTIQSADGGSGTLGDIRVNDSVIWSANTLTLQAFNNIYINAPLTGNASVSPGFATASLALQYGQGAVATGNTSGYFVSAPVTLPAGNTFSTKQGSNGSTVAYTVITTLTALQNIDGNATVLAGNYAMGGDIDAGALAAGSGFNPIGDQSSGSTAGAFMGRFDGLGHSVTGLTISRATSASVGLFANTNNASISNLDIVGGSVTGGGQTGSLVGLASGTTNLRNVSSTAAVTGTTYAGGLVGNMAGSGNITTAIATGAVTGTTNVGGLVGQAAGTGRINDATATGSVTGSGSTASVGGLIGNATLAGGLSQVLATGSVTGGDLTGGLVGNYASAGNISNARAEGTVSGSTTVGGLVGYASGTGGSLTASMALGNVSATTNNGYVGGLVGRFAMTGGLTQGEAAGTVLGGNYSGGLVGYYNTTAALDNGVARGTTVTGFTYVGGLVGYSDALSISGSTATANVTANPTGSGMAGGLVGRSAGSITGVSGTTTASGNVVGSGYVGGVVGDAAGTGALVNLTATGNVTGATNSGNAGGLAGQVSSGSVVRGMASGTVTGGYLTGGLIGNLERAGADIIDGMATGNVTGGTNVGGLVGRVVSSGALLSGGIARGNVQAITNDGSVGGLVGVFNMSNGMSNSSAYGTVSGGTQTGGLVGYFAVAAPLVGGTANGSTVVGGTQNAGGLLGYSIATSISGSTAVADVIGSGNAGGLVGYNAGSITGVSGTVTASGNVSGTQQVGGLVGEARGSGTFSNVLVTGNVSGTGTSSSYYVGGLVGLFANSGSGNIQGARATGNVVAVNTAGGLVGYATGSGGISNSTAAGNVAATGSSYYVGGLVGYLSMGGGVTGVAGTATATGTVAGGGYTGGLVGYLGAGTITITRATGDVAGGAYAGGLVGYFGGAGSLSYSTASGAVQGAVYTGGLVGQFASAAELSYSTASGNVVGTTNVGGLVGSFVGGNITNATASGRVTGSTNVGGLLGAWVNSGNITDSRAQGDVFSQAYAGGLVGYGTNNGSINNSSASGNVSGRTFVGGLVGELQGTNLTLGNASGNVLGIGNSSNTVYAGGLIGFYSNSETGGQISNSTASGNVFADGYSTRAGGLVGELGAGRVVSTLTVTGATGNVTATDSTSTTVNGTLYAGGLVGNFRGSDITGGSASGNVVGRDNTGGLVGAYSGTAALTSGSASGNVTGTQYVGGLVGRLESASLVGGRASGAVVATFSTGTAGGLVGYVRSSSGDAVVSDSTASGSVSAGQNAGGLVGNLESYAYVGNALRTGIVNSRASGDVSGAVWAGGLVGVYLDVYGASSRLDVGISASQASGSVRGTQGAGGLVGSFSSSSGISDSAATGDMSITATAGGASTRYLGGLAGWFQNFNATANAGGITRSWAGGSVTLPNTVVLTSTTDVYAGGLVGYLDGYAATSLTVTDAYATGAVSAANTVGRLRVGGLVGYTDTSLARSYSTGAVTATGGTSQVVGGLVAQRVGSTATATNSFWATDSSGQATSVIGTAKTLAQLKDSATFTGWDVATSGGSTSVWRIYQGQTAPLLRGLLTPLTAPLANLARAYDGSTSLAGAVLAGGTAYALDPHPERIFVGGVSADVGSVNVTPGNVYSVQNGYDLSLTGSSTLTINQRPLTLAGLAANKVYDATLAATLKAGAQPGNLVAGEDLVFQPGNDFALQFADKNVGTGKTVNLAGSYAYTDGARGKASNYLLPTATGTTANITPAALTAGSFAATPRAYDGTTTVAVTASASTLTGVLGTDAVGVDLSSVTSGTVASKTVGTAKAVTVLGASITGADAGNYTLAGIAGVTVDIAPKAVVANGITATNRAYNTSTSVALNTTATTLSGLVTGDSVVVRTDNLLGTVANKNAQDGKAVTVAGLALRGPDAGNYSLSQGAVTVNITPYQLTLALAANSQTNRIYDGSNTAFVSFPTFYWYGGDNLIVSASSVTFDNKNVAYNGSGQVTTKTITASGISLAGTDAANYTLLTPTLTIAGTISPKPLAVTGITASNRAYDGTRDVAVNVASATVNTAAIVSGDNVSVLIPGSGNLTGQVTNKNVGTGKAVTVPGLAITGSDAGNYTLGSSGTGVTVNITKKNLTAVYTSADKVYDGNGYARTTASSTDIVSGDTVIFYSNYSFGQGVNLNSTYTGSGAKNVGNNKGVNILFEALYIGADIGNYNLVNATTAASNGGIYGTATSSITAKPVTLAFSGVSKVYDGTPAATVTLNFGGTAGVVPGDTLTSTQTAVYTGANAKDVGTSKPISVTGIMLGGTDAANYTVANTTATANNGSITAKAVTLAGISATDRAYDGTLNVAVTAGTITSSGFVGGDTVSVAQPSGGLSAGTITNRNIGSNKPVTVTGLTLSGADAPNYTIDVVGSGITVNITPKVLTPTYTGGTQVYDGGVLALVTASTAALVAGDGVGFSQQAVFTGANARNVGTSKDISVTNIALTGNSTARANYTLASTTASTSGSITPKAVTVQYTGVARVYNGVADTSATVQGTSLQLLFGDNVGFSQSARFSGDGAAGTGKAVAVSGIGLTGTDAPNYMLSNSTANATADITRRQLGVTGITATNRIYDGTTTVAVSLANATVDTSAVIAGDVVSVALPPSGISTGTVADRHVGSGKAVSITGLAIAGSEAANYQLIGATGLTVNITPRPLTASYAGLNKVYDGSTTAGVGATLPDLLAVDNGLVLVTAQGLFGGGKNVGTAKDISVSGGFLSGAGRDDYVLANPTGTTTANITPKAVTASYTAGLSKVYDHETAAPTSGRLFGLVIGDAVGLTQTATFSDRNAGNNKIVSITDLALSGNDLGNYTLQTTSANTTANITPKPITVSGLNNVLASDRVYDGTTVVTVTVPAGVTLQPQSADVFSGDQISIAVPSSGITSGSVPNKNAANGKVVTVDGLTLTGADRANYSIAGTAGITVNIAPKGVTASYSGINRVYNGNTAATASGTSTDILAGDLVSIVGTGVFTGDGARNAGVGKAVAVQTASLQNNNASNNDAANYTLLNNSGSTTADITPRSVTASYTGGSKVYDGLSSAPVTGSAGFIAGDAVALTQTAVFTGAGARNVGNQKAISVTGIALTGSDTANYSLSNNSLTTTGSITPKDLRIDGLTGVTATDRVYDGTRNVTVLVTSSGTLTPNAADLVAGDVVTVNAPPSGTTTGTVATKNVGGGKAVTVTGLTLGGAAGANYSISATDGVTVNITPKALTASYGGVSKVYDGLATTAVTGSASGVVGGDSVTITGVGSYTGAGAKNVGDGKALDVTSAQLASTDAANYTLLNPTGSALGSITPKTVTASYTGGTKVYDGLVTAPVTGSASGFISNDDVALQATANFTGSSAKNVGNGKAVAVTGITLSGNDASNYRLAANSTSTTASITPKDLRIEGLTGVTATDRVYDGTRTVAVTVTASGPIAPNPADVVAGDVVSVNAPSSGTTTGTVATKNVGSNKAVTVAGLALTGADSGNYSVASASGITVNITPKPLTATYTGQDKVYDGNATATVLGSANAVELNDSVLFAINAVFSGSAARNAGAGKAVDVLGATLGGTDAPNYLLLNPTGSTTASISPKALTASWLGGSKVYDGLVSAPVTGSLAGVVGSDAVGLLQSAAFTGSEAKNVGDGKAVAISSIGLTGAEAGNYSVAGTATTTASVTPKPLRVEGLTGLTAVDRAYDRTLNVDISVQSSGTASPNAADVVAGDTVTITLPSGGVSAGLLTDNWNVGNNKPVTVSGLALGGTDAANYSIAAATGVTVNITPRVLTASYTGLNKVYDGTAAASVTATSAGIISGDVVDITGAGQFTGSGAKNAGTGKTIAVTSAQLSNSDAGNYSLANPTGTAFADITPRVLTPGYSGGSKVYDGSTTAPVTALATGVVAGDSLSFSQTAVFGDNAGGNTGRNVGSGKTIVVSGISLLGDDRANYSLASDSATTTGRITPRPLSVSGLSGFSAVDRVYDGSTQVQITGSGALTGALSNVVEGDTVSVSLPSSGINAGTMLDKNAGSAKPVALTGLTLAGADAANYEITGTAGVTVNIFARGVTLGGLVALDRVYDGGTQVAIDTRAGTVSGVLPGDDLRVPTSGTTGTLADKSAGLARPVTVTTLALSGSDAGNYFVESSGSLTAVIAPRPLTATASAADRVYDGSTTASITLLDNRVAGDTLGVSATSATFADKQVGSAKAVTVAGLTLAGADAANYVLANTGTGAVASITPRPLVVTASAVDKVYDGSTAAVSSLADNRVAGDGLTVTSSSARFADTHAGVGKLVTASGFSLQGSDAGNYTLANTGATTAASITPRPLAVSASVATKVYNGDIGASVTLLDDRLGSDLVSVDGSARFDSASAGTGKRVNVAGLALSGRDAGDYMLSSNSLSALGTIEPAPLTVTANALNKVYGNSLVFAGTEFSTQGLVAGETAGPALLGSSGADVRADVAASPYSITVSGLTGLGGAVGAAGSAFDPDNYTIRYTPGALTVTPRPLTVAGPSVVRFADQPNPSSFTAEVVGGSLVGDDRIGTLQIPAPAGSAGAAGLAVFALVPTGATFATGNPANYTLRYSSGLLVVLPTPPRIGDAESSEEGTGNGTGLGILDLPAALVEGARTELDNTASLVTLRPAAAIGGDAGNGGNRTPGWWLPTTLAPATAAELAVALSGDSRRITLPALRRLPLISFDPTLRPAAVTAPVSSGATPNP